MRSTERGVRNAECATGLEEFREELEREDLSPATVRGYLGDVKLFRAWYVESYDEECRPERIVTREVQEYRTWLQSKGSAPASINRRLASLQKWLGAAGSTVAAGIKGVRVTDPGVQALSSTELRRLLREVHKRGESRDIAMIEMLCGTGMRVGELVGLKVEDVEISGRRGSVLIRSGKGRSSRLIPLNVDVRKALAAWVEVRPTGHGEGLYLGQRGALTASAVWRLVRQYGDYAGIEELHVHQLRHTVLTRMVRELGMDLATVARISGHRDLRTLMRYCEPSRADLEAAVEGLALGGLVMADEQRQRLERISKCR